jgi:uracil-DNA glycosylase
MRFKIMSKRAFNSLIASVRECTLCANELVAGVRPVLQVHPEARILIAGQAPGSKVHATGVPFDDPSGNRLRDWMGIDRDTFYDETRIAILPMGFCYPGKGKSGDLPPKPICAETWRDKLINALPNIHLTLVIGQYAQAWHLPIQHDTLTETVRDWANYDDDLMPLPHPSPRNNIWLKKNPWFESETLPVLKRRVAKAI